MSVASIPTDIEYDVVCRKLTTRFRRNVFFTEGRSRRDYESDEGNWIYVVDRIRRESTRNKRRGPKIEPILVWDIFILNVAANLY